jgi:hypothetical protein
MTLAPRELAITYNGFLVGTGSAHQIHAYWTNFDDFEVAEVGFQVLVSGASVATFAAACIAVEAAFRDPYGDLTVVQGASTLLSLSQSSNTGLDAQPSIQATGDPRDTGRSRLYTVRIQFGRPANNVPRAGLRRWSVNIEYSPSRRRTVTFQGTYTAVSSNDARDQYESAIAALCTSKLTDFGGTYELVGEPTTSESTNDKTLDFLRVFRERLTNQGSSLDDSALVDTVLQVGKTRTNAGHSSGAGSSQAAVELVVVRAHFEAWVDKTVTTDLEAKYASIRDSLIERIETLAASRFAVTEESPSYDKENARIIVDLVGLATDSMTSGAYTRFRATVAKTKDEGKVFVGVWDGKPNSYRTYQGKQAIFYTVTLSGQKVGAFSAEEIDADTLSIAKGLGGDNVIAHASDATQVRLGLPDERTIDLTDFSSTTVMRVVDAPGSGGTSAGIPAASGGPR